MSSDRRSFLRRAAPLLLLVALALLPRVHEVGRYLPDHFHPDEDKEIRRAIQLARGEVDLQRRHKGFLFVLLTVEYGALYTFQRATGAVDSTEEFGRRIAADHSMLFLLSRLTVALMGAICVLLAYRITRRLGGTGAALLAAGLVLVFEPHLHLSRLGRLDVPLCMCALLVVDLSLAAMREPTTRRMLLLAAAAGLTVCAKTSGAPFLIIAIPPFYRWLRSASDVRGSGARFAGALMVSVLVVAIFNSALLFFVATGGGGGRELDWQGILAEQYTGGAPDRVRNYIVQPAEFVGFTALLLAVLGMVLLTRKRLSLYLHFVAAVTLGVVLQIVLVWNLSDLTSWRYVLPGQVIVLLFAALGARHLAQLAPRGAVRKAAFGILAAALLLPHAHHGAMGLRRDLLEPTTVAMRKWIEANLPEGSPIALEGKDVFPSQYMPRLKHSPSSLEDHIEALREQARKTRANEQMAKADSLENKAGVLERYWLPSLPEPGYQLTLYAYSKNEILSRAWFRDRAVRYLVVHEVNAPEGTGYRRSVDAVKSICNEPGVKLRAEIIGDDESFSGRTVRLYDLGD